MIILNYFIIGGLIMDNSSRFQEYREQYEEFHYNDFTIREDDKSF